MNGNRRNIVAAIRGPILLITLGTLVAADYAGGYRFALTWPVLVIVFGILKLLERMGAHTPQSTVNRPPGGSVI